jgi:hypothetical protein
MPIPAVDVVQNNLLNPASVGILAAGGVLGIVKYLLKYFEERKGLLYLLR